MNRTVVVHLTPSLPPGVTIAPASPSVSECRRTTRSASSFRCRSRRGSRRPAIRSRWSRASPLRSVRYPLASAALTVDIPYASLQAAYDNDCDQRRRQYRGGQLRRERQQLLGASADRRRACSRARSRDAPTGRRCSGPTSRQVHPTTCSRHGQTISLAGFAGGHELTVLGASSGADESGTGLIQYTDGTSQPYTLTLDNWFNPAEQPVQHGDRHHGLRK